MEAVFTTPEIVLGVFSGFLSQLDLHNFGRTCQEARRAIICLCANYRHRMDNTVIIWENEKQIGTIPVILDHNTQRNVLDIPHRWFTSPHVAFHAMMTIDAPTECYLQYISEHFASGERGLVSLFRAIYGTLPDWPEDRYGYARSNGEGYSNESVEAEYPILFADYSIFQGVARGMYEQYLYSLGYTAGDIQSLGDELNSSICCGIAPIPVACGFRWLPNRYGKWKQKLNFPSKDLFLYYLPKHM